jgi:hypothetical protein
MKKNYLVGFIVGILFIGFVGIATATPLTFSGTLYDGITVYGTTLDGYDWWKFEGTTGDVVDITLNRTANQSDGSGTLDPFVSLFFGTDTSTYTYLTFDDDSGSDTPPGPYWNSLISNYNLPSTGTYSVQALASIGEGPYALTLTGSGGAPIPEPATMLLLGTGLAGVAGAARRKKKNQA